jgi:hypothetical protein
MNYSVNVVKGFLAQCQSNGEAEDRRLKVTTEKKSYFSLRSSASPPFFLDTVSAFVIVFPDVRGV